MHDLSLQPASNGRAKMKKRMRYEIRDLSGTVVAIHHRTDLPDGTKSIWWTQPDGTKHLGGKKAAELPLFGTELLAKAEYRDGPIVITEGEKAAQSLQVRFVPAVGTVTGARLTPTSTVLDVLRDRVVILWPDNDELGRKHMCRIGEKLRGIAKSVMWFEWPGAPKGGDAADFPGGEDELLAALNKETGHLTALSIQTVEREQAKSPG
jgi:hypothetical protein